MMLSDAGAVGPVVQSSFQNIATCPTGARPLATVLSDILHQLGQRLAQEERYHGTAPQHVQLRLDEGHRLLQTAVHALGKPPQHWMPVREVRLLRHYIMLAALHQSCHYKLSAQALTSQLQITIMTRLTIFFFGSSPGLIFEIT
jgi:hypothetical protein